MILAVFLEPCMRRSPNGKYFEIEWFSNGASKWVSIFNIAGTKSDLPVLAERRFAA